MNLHALALSAIVGDDKRGAMSDTVTIRGADGADYAYTLNRVLDSLIQTLMAGRFDAAVTLYAQIREDVAFQLIGRTQGNVELFRLVANLLFQARDYQRAGYCCEQLDEPGKAAALYERADDFAAAAQMYATTGDSAKAAEMFEKAGSLVDAAKLHLHLHGQQGGVDHAVRAAMCFERAGRLLDAAMAWENADRMEKALSLYHAIDDDSPEKKHAKRQIMGLEARLALTRAPGALTAELGAVDVDDLATGGDGRDGPGGGAGHRVTMMEGFEFLRQLPLFVDVSLTDLKSIYHLCDVVDVPAGARLIEAGQPSPALWVLLTAVVAVRGAGGRDVARLAAGAPVGDMGLFDDAAAGVDVVVVQPGRTLRLQKAGFSNLMAANDALALRIHRVLFRTMRDRLRSTTDRYLAGPSS
jgi:hypothetical protein